MCGIAGYIGRREAIPIVLGGLYSLEYRGYDSAGIAAIGKNYIEVHKVAGKVYDLDRAITSSSMSKTGIGHCRWASHGRVTRANAHPFVGCLRRFAIVHNGIIENHNELRVQLSELRHFFESETDSEVVVHLLEESQGSFFSRVLQTVNQLEGSFALAMIDKEDPDTIIVARKGSPIIVGIGAEEMFVSSDIPAIAKHTNQVYHLEDNEIAVITKTTMDIYDFEGNKKVIELTQIDEDFTLNDLGSTEESFMLKEIHEQPEACERLVQSLIHMDLARNEEMIYSKFPMFRSNRFNLIGCGSAYYAALFSAQHFNRWPNQFAQAHISSEIQQPDEEATNIVFSQSGETFDTIEVAKRFYPVQGLINVKQSSLERECENFINLECGPEISVASTKAFTSMALAGAMLAQETFDRHNVEQFKAFPDALREALALEDKVKEIVHHYCSPKIHENPLFIGKGAGYAIALEASLKLKEIAYIHSHALPSSELKHGPLALITDDYPVFAIVPNDEHIGRNITAIEEIKARKGYVYAITNSDEPLPADSIIKVPSISPLLDPILCLMPLQLLAYYIAKHLGRDIDKPRNLAKSVTIS